MKIAITREELLRQMDEHKTDNSQEFKSTFVIEGLQVPDETQSNPLDETLAHVRLHLTRKEYLIFRELYRADGNTVRYSALSALLTRTFATIKVRPYQMLQNNVACHVAHIRRKITIAGLPYRITTRRDGTFSGGYALLKLHS